MLLKEVVQCTMKQNPLAGFIFGICVKLIILNPFLGYFMLGDPKTTPRVMLIILYHPFLMISSKMANFASSGPIFKIQNAK